MHISPYSNVEVSVYRGDELLHSGKIGLVAQKMGIKPASLYFYLMPSYQKRLERRKSNPDRCIQVVRL